MVAARLAAALTIVRMTTTPARATRIELQGIVKRYTGALALDGVDLRVAPGEIHALLGENGAGKSTLMRIACGAERADAGTLRWNGAPLSLRNPRDARALGIAMVFQQFALFDSLTTAENVRLGLLDASLGLAEVSARMRSAAAEYGLDVDPRRPVRTLSAGERQRVELLRALLASPSLLILDEPTSVLAPAAVQSLFATLRRLAAGGCSVLYASHKLDEIGVLADRCTVLRDGRVVALIEDPANETRASLARAMIGAEPPCEPPPRARAPGDFMLDVRGLSLAPAGRFGVALHDVALQVRAGEIVGIAGVSGNGQRELMAALSGEDRRAAAGSIVLAGTYIARRSPPERRALGLRFVPEQRLGHAAGAELTLAENTRLTRDSGDEADDARRLASRLIDRFGIKARGPDDVASTLSGGNLQKFVAGREIDARPIALLIVEQPTAGIDIAAAARIGAELRALRDAGCALLVASDDLDELLELCDRLLVMAGGRLSPGVPAHEATPAWIGERMSGLWPQR